MEYGVFLFFAAWMVRASLLYSKVRDSQRRVCKLMLDVPCRLS